MHIVWLVWHPSHTQNFQQRIGHMHLQRLFYLINQLTIPTLENTSLFHKLFNMEQTISSYKHSAGYDLPNQAVWSKQIHPRSISCVFLGYSLKQSAFCVLMLLILRCMSQDKWVLMRHYFHSHPLFWFFLRFKSCTFLHLWYFNCLFTSYLSSAIFTSTTSVSSFFSWKRLITTSILRRNAIKIGTSSVHMSNIHIKLNK